VRSDNRTHSPETRLALRFFQIVAAIGLLYGLALLAGDAPNANYRHIVYTLWFGVTVVSIEAILNWLKTGVYALVTMTVVVTLVDILEGVATLGGATLGLLVAFVIVVYLLPMWRQFD
jgi:hypothetical protein